MRIRQAVKAVLVGIDCAVAALCMAPKFVIAGGQVPNGRQTLSGLVGRAATNGKRWGLLLEKPLDAAFSALGSRPEHCRRTYRFERSRGIQS